MFYRLIKPMWGKEKIKKGDKWVSNPNLTKSIKGRDIIEGCFSEKYIKRKNEEGYNIYFFPNHPSKNIYSEEKKFLGGRDINVFNYLFVDMDLKDGEYESKEEFYEKLKEFPLPPTFVVSSGHGVHAYWRIENLTRELYIFGQLALIKKLKTDPSVWTVLQLMRVPNYYNTKKYGEFVKAEIIEDISSGEIYNIKDFYKYIEKLSEEDVEKGKKHLDRLDGKLSVDLSKDINIDELPEKLLDLFDQEKDLEALFRDPIGTLGDRSKADMVLCNALFTHDFSYSEALQVISNTHKALEKGDSREEYASLTVDKVYTTRIQSTIKSVGQRMREGKRKPSGNPVKGPTYMDCLVNGWRTKQVLGLIGGSGVGKTAATLDIFKEMIFNNPQDDDVFVFFSLEMPEDDIMDIWEKLIGEDLHLADKLYVIANEDEHGEPRNIGLQEVVWYVKDVEKMTGKKVKSVAIDHSLILNRSINLKKKPTLGAEAELEGIRRSKGSLPYAELCKKFKPLAKYLDIFLIVLTQTTKSKGVGDVPIEKDGGFGTAAYEWMMDFIITIWQPLMRVQNKTDLRVLAWQYAKIRQKHKEDPMQAYEYKLLTYDMDTGRLRPTTPKEFSEFEILHQEAEELRKESENKKSSVYSISVDTKKLNKLLKRS